MTKVTDLIERLKDDSSDLVYHERHEAAAELLRLSSECEALREGWQNAVFALEYWDRECRHAGKSPLWAEGPTERTFIELQRHRTTLQETNGGGDADVRNS